MTSPVNRPVILAPAGIDPALLDRRSQRLPVTFEADLPVRMMHIAGLEGRMEARILSKDLAGPATRLVQIPAGYGSGVTGAFTADLEMFVIRGLLQVGGESVGENDYVAVRRGQVISGLRAEETGLALLATSAPIRFDTAAGGVLSPPLVGRGSDGAWSTVEQMPGRFVLPLSEGLRGPVFLSGFRGWSNENGFWHSHDAAEEMFVLEGSLTLTEQDGDEVIVEHFHPGAYLFRLPGRFHAGPGSHASDGALVFFRMLGPRTVHWSPPTPDPAPDSGQPPSS